MAIYAPTSDTGTGNHKKVASLVTVNLEELIDNDLSSITIDGTNYNINKNNLYNLSVELLNEIKNSNHGGTGGVIDGEILVLVPIPQDNWSNLNQNTKDNLSIITRTLTDTDSTTKEVKCIKYKVQNDCLLRVCLADFNINTQTGIYGCDCDIIAYRNGGTTSIALCDYQEIFSGYDKSAIGFIPAKKGLELTFTFSNLEYDYSEATPKCSRVFVDCDKVTGINPTVVEFKLVDTDPQIAFPDWDNNKAKNISDGDTIPDNGWILCSPIIDKGYSGSVSINGIAVANQFASDSSGSDPMDKQLTVIPVSKGDIITFTRFGVIFYPIKTISQEVHTECTGSGGVIDGTVLNTTNIIGSDFKNKLATYTVKNDSLVVITARPDFSTSTDNLEIYLIDNNKEYSLGILREIVTSGDDLLYNGVQIPSKSGLSFNFRLNNNPSSNSQDQTIVQITEYKLHSLGSTHTECLGSGGVIDGTYLEKTTKSLTITDSNLVEAYVVKNDCGLYIESPFSTDVLNYGIRWYINSIESPFYAMAESQLNHPERQGTITYVKAGSIIYVNRPDSSFSQTGEFTFIEYKLHSLDSTHTECTGSGGVIDGTICKNEDGTDCITEFTKDNGLTTGIASLRYVTKNDCLLAILVSGLDIEGGTNTSSGNDDYLFVKVNGNKVSILGDTMNDTTSLQDAVSSTIPVKKGSIVTIEGSLGGNLFQSTNNNSLVQFIEYKLHPLDSTHTECLGSGGVIDGTVLYEHEYNWQEEQIDGIPGSGKPFSDWKYEVKNDCLLYVSINHYIDKYFINDKEIFNYSVSENGTILVPVKKGSILSNNYSSAIEYSYKLKVIEFKLNSLNPQVAFPDWTNNKAVNIKDLIDSNIDKKYVINNDGFLVVKSSYYTSKLFINNIEVFSSVFDIGIHAESNTCSIPVSIGDIITYTLTETDVTQEEFDIKFYPAKSVNQEVPSNCASYVIESGRFNSSTGTTDSENDSWYRLYSDGWCEQGGTKTRLPERDTDHTLYTTIKLFSDKPYNSDYQINLTVYKTDDNLDHDTYVYQKSNDTFKVRADDTAQGGQLFWETKGFIN